MTNPTITTPARDLLYLLSCAVNDEQPNPERCAAMDTQAVFELAKRHSLTVAAAYALEQAAPLPETCLIEKTQAIRRLALYNIERAAVLGEIERRGVRYLPLKGILLRRCYPKEAMREMSDNDILFDSARAGDVRAIMESLGYVCKLFDKSHHDVYTKPPQITFEMHRSLFNEYRYPEEYRYFTAQKEHYLPVEGSRCAFRMTDEDFYLYLIAHQYHHYIGRGSGLRSLLDVYVYMKRYENELDRAYLQRELDTLGMRAFEEGTRVLAQKVFTGQQLTANEERELAYYLDSGAHGTADNILSRDLQRDDSTGSKLRYLGRRLLISDENMKRNHPFVDRHRILYPPLLVCRLLSGLVTHPKTIVREIMRVKRFKQNDTYGEYNR